MSKEKKPNLSLENQILKQRIAQLLSDVDDLKVKSTDPDIKELAEEILNREYQNQK